MAKLSNGIDKVRHDAIRNTAGTGYVVLSLEMDRDTYVANCYRNSTVTIITESNEVIKNVLVNKDVWQYLDFPESFKERGSCVVWLNIHGKNKPIILAVVNKKDQYNEIQTTNSFKFNRGDKLKNSVTIEGLGNNGIINIITHGSNKDESQVNIRILNTNAEGLLDLLVQGEIGIEGERSARIRLKSALELIIKDEENNELDMIFKMKDKLFQLQNTTTSLKKVLVKIMTTYLSTQTIDGKPLSASSIQKAQESISEISKLLK